MTAEFAFFEGVDTPLDDVDEVVLSGMGSKLFEKLELVRLDAVEVRRECGLMWEQLTGGVAIGEGGVEVMSSNGRCFIGCSRA